MKTEISDDAGKLAITVSATTVTVSFGKVSVQLPSDEAVGMLRSAISAVMREQTKAQAERRRLAREQRELGQRPAIAASRPSGGEGAA